MVESVQVGLATATGDTRRAGVQCQRRRAGGRSGNNSTLTRGCSCKSRPPTVVLLLLEQPLVPPGQRLFRGGWTLSCRREVPKWIAMSPCSTKQGRATWVSTARRQARTERREVLPPYAFRNGSSEGRFEIVSDTRTALQRYLVHAKRRATSGT